jgi:hypothetical protein
VFDRAAAYESLQQVNPSLEARLRTKSLATAT